MEHRVEQAMKWVIDDVWYYLWFDCDRLSDADIDALIGTLYDAMHLMYAIDDPDGAGYYPYIVDMDNWGIV